MEPKEVYSWSNLLKKDKTIKAGTWWNS